MSEYWKSTPKYWCKHCKTYVRDTKLEKQNHEATPKHQGNLKRFLRDLHRSNERDEREKQRAKDEVARLNGTASGMSVSSMAGSKSMTSLLKPSVRPPSTSQPQQATPAERKKQMARLAELGVAVPEEYRREMAMAGDWQITSERFIYDDVKKEEELEDAKPNGLNVGIRKRKQDKAEDEEQEAGESGSRKSWGLTTRTYPGAREDDADLDTLLNFTSTAHKKEPAGLSNSSTGMQPHSMQSVQTNNSGSPDVPFIKEENSFEGDSEILPLGSTYGESTVKQEDGLDGASVVFKKRKPKPIRQRG
ncbi:MAG: hypothetical protein Q9187_008909 [Circinaria calcarea]